MTSAICNRPFFQHDNQDGPVAESGVESSTSWSPSWSPLDVDLVKKRSAFFKPIILYLQDDPNRPPEHISFYMPSKESKNNADHQSHPDSISLPR
ncbi:hypothetical protein QBC40DRAFT_334418 [Triangularia verruculosa]|uniref:Uncharacterized protein n=1 Tax=Triangularia verruculosa TaxID=2587418 RepID=A0AAN7ATM2_9PEZI|nr:hypothetical protein QBC40DRAFT_334418 [Triangularia verruculosa]